MTTGDGSQHASAANETHQNKYNDLYHTLFLTIFEPACIQRKHEKYSKVSFFFQCSNVVNIVK
jgi:hypothetical protein